MPSLQDLLPIFEPTAKPSIDHGRQLTLELPSAQLGFSHLYGGQAFSQSVATAQQWLHHFESTMQVHAVNGTFLKAGVNHLPVTYKLTPLGRGRTFQRFLIHAFQNDTLVYAGTVSAQRVEPAFLEHQQLMPEVKGPEGLMTEAALKSKISGNKIDASARPVEILIATPDVYFKAADANEPQGYWFRCKGEPVAVGSHTSQCVLAYASDYGFLGAIYVPHDLTIKRQPVFLTSLDHSLWYYGDYNPQEWAYFESTSPVARGGRALVTGRIFQHRQLIAVATQEGLIRRRGSS